MPRAFRRPQTLFGRGDWLIALFAALTLVLALMTCLAPVVVSDPVVSWPQAGSLPHSTVVGASPYRPLTLKANIPCATLRSLDLRGGGEALRTLPMGVESTENGLTVSAGHGWLRIAGSGTTIVDQPLPSGECSYGVNADGSGIHLKRDNTPVADKPGLEVPQVAQLATDADGSPAAQGMSVSLHTDDRYDAAPSTVKVGFLIALALSLLGTLALALRRFRGRGPGLTWPRVCLADAALLVILAAWVFFGPLNFDDSWYELMAKNARLAGYVGNYIWQFNVSESPFVLDQHALGAWASVGGWSLAWMRVLPLLYAIGTWTALRLVLANVVPPKARPRFTQWALLIAFLVWWLPDEMTLRPEPLVVFLSAVVLVLEEAARRRRSIGLLSVAVACVGLALTASPAGMTAAAPLLVSLPWLWRWLKQQPRSAQIGAVALLLAAGTTFVPVSFWHQSLANVLEASAVHVRYSANAFPPYQEFVHYQALLSNPAIAWGRRAPVLLTIALVAVIAVARLRRGRAEDPLSKLLLTSAVSTACALALLALTPTKQTLHFPDAAAAPILLLTAAILRSPSIGQRRLLQTASAVVIGFAASLAFAGPNWWPPYSDRGQAFAGRFASVGPTPPMLEQMSPHLGPLYLGSPWIWLLVALVAGWLSLKLRRRGSRFAISPDRALVLTSCVAVVGTMLCLFAYAPLHQYPGWSVAFANAKAVTGSGCGLSNAATVLVGAEAGLGAPAGGAQLTGDFADAAPTPIPAPAPIPGPIWHDNSPGRPAGTSSLASGWYPLPANGDASAVSVFVLGAHLAQQHAEVQFGYGDPMRPEPQNPTPLAPDPAVGDRTWQQLAVDLPTRQPRPTAVRILATAANSQPDSFAAISQPRLVRPRPLTTVTGGRPVLADQLSAALTPCVHHAAIAHGLAEAPAVEIHTGDFLPTDFKNAATGVPTGGAFAQTNRTATHVRLASQLGPGSRQTPVWGHIERDLYPYPVGLVDMSVSHQQRNGWTLLKTLATTPYLNQPYRK
jgi:arabinosyltransferase B/arabinosyltransferase C